jgi:hypothetical protein
LPYVDASFCGKWSGPNIFMKTCQRFPLGCYDQNPPCVCVSFHAEVVVITTQCVVCIFPWGYCDQRYTHHCMLCVNFKIDLCWCKFLWQVEWPKYLYENMSKVSIRLLWSEPTVCMCIFPCRSCYDHNTKCHWKHITWHIGNRSKNLNPPPTPPHPPRAENNTSLQCKGQKILKFSIKLGD